MVVGMGVLVVVWLVTLVSALLLFVAVVVLCWVGEAAMVERFVRLCAHG